MKKNTCCRCLKSQKSDSLIRRIAAKVPIKRTLWWIFAVSFAGLFIWECYQMIDDFIRQPYVTTVTTVENSSIELPIIRVCPASWINNTALKEQNVTVEQLEMLMEGFTESYLADTTDKSHLDLDYEQFLTGREEFNIKQFFKQISLKCTEIFHYCRWQTDTVKCCDGENEAINLRNPLTNVGQCYLMFKKRSVDDEANFRQSVPGPGGGLLIHMNFPAEESEVPGLAVCL